MTSTLFRSALAMGLLTVCMAMFRELQTNPTTTKRPMGPATYWITYSKTVRPGHPMIFQVQIFQGSLPVDMYFTLKDSKGADVIRHGPVSVTPKVPSKISIPIPFDVKRPSDDKYYWQQYTVQVTGNSSENAIKEKGVASYEEKAFSIFVQTDKAMYKPSQTVQFRTLAMTPDMKVLRDVKQDIVVFDARGNRILQFRGVEASAKLGVFEKSFKLASSVPTGNWKIKVTIEGIEEEKEFEVADYVLPRFEVEVDGSSFGVNTDLLYEFTVKAKYTFGKPVTAGTVLVEIAVGNMYYNNDNPKPIIKRGELDNNGELTLQVTLDDLLRLGNSYNKYYDSKTVQSWWDFAITANVTETRTGRKHSGQHIVKFHNTPIQMKFLGITPNSFKSGLDYTAYLEIKKQDGTLFSPLELKQMSVNINVTYSVPESTTTTTTTTTQSPTHSGRIPLPAKDEIFTGGRWYQRYEQRVLKLDKSIYSIPETGWIVLTFRVPDEARELNLKAQTISPFAEEVTQYKSASKSYSPTESFLQLSVINKKPRVGDMIEVVAKSTDQMTVLNYQVFSKGLLVASKQINGPSNNMAFQFEATASMSPSMSIVAFYVRDDGEFVVDALSVSVDGLFDNAVKAEFTKEKVKPGEAVNLVVKGEKDSVVFLLVVDKSVKLLKSGNDITQDMVREELASYDYGNYGDWRYMFICGWPSYFGGNDAKAVFENAGVEVMTDGLVYSRYQDEDYYLEDGAIPTQGAGIPESVPDSSNQGNANEKRGDMKPAERTRKYFPENWLWNIEIIE